MSQINKTVKLEIQDESWKWTTNKLFEMVYPNEGPHVGNYSEFFNREDIPTVIYKLSEFIFKRAQSKVIYPSMEDVFRSLQTDNPKVLIMGQDCYHDGAATGLCFSVPANRKMINPSLKSIQKEVTNNGFKVNTKCGNLSNWAKQGVLMLNAALTVEEANPGSHTSEWAEFTTKFVEYITTNHQHIAILLWGNDAQSYEDDIKNNKSHFVFKCSHPMPLAASKSVNGKPAFFGSDCFNKVNSYLVENKKKAICWDIL